MRAQPLEPFGIRCQDIPIGVGVAWLGQSDLSLGHQVADRRSQLMRQVRRKSGKALEIVCNRPSMSFSELPGSAISIGTAQLACARRRCARTARARAFCWFSAGPIPFGPPPAPSRPPSRAARVT